MPQHDETITFPAFNGGARALCVAALALALSACQEPEKSEAAPPPPEVGVMVVKAEDAPLTTELPGRTSPYLVAEVRPQVNGILMKRLFEEGGVVKKGQALYLIDPAPYQAAYAQAEAAHESARLLYERYAKLLDSEAVSQQEHDDAYSQYRQTKAALETARINLGYTRIVAPITGRIGRSSVTQGALLTAYQGQSMATIQQLDPIYVDIPQSSTAMLTLRDALESGQLTRGADGQVAVTLQLDNGKDYPHEGKLQFSEVTVDENSNTVTIRALFPNPDGRLLPGMFVRARFTEGVRTQALMVPQRAVTRTPSGKATALVVTADNTVETREIVADQSVGNRWIVSDGLRAGERVIVDGVQKVRAGDTVTVAEPSAPNTPAGRPAATTASPDSSAR